MTAAGDVSDYDAAAQASLVSNMASTLGVPEADVSLTVTAASVNLVFEVAVADETEAEAVAQQADSSLGTAADATTALGVSVQSAPVTATVAASPLSPPVASPSPPSPSPPSPSSPEKGSSDNAAALAGAVVGGLVVMGCVVVCVIMKGRKDGQRDAVKNSAMEASAGSVDVSAAHVAGGMKRDAV